MSDHINHFTDEGLDLTQANSYNLLLQINKNSFNYAITHDKQLLAWAENFSLDELKDPQQINDVLTANYKQVIVGLASTGFTLLPNMLFDSKHVGDVARLLDVSDNEEVYYQTLDNENVIVYKADEYQTDEIANFDNAGINHKAKGWINAIALSTPLNTNLYLNVADNSADFLYFNDNKLRFYNSFTFENEAELAYYCAFVTRELKIEPQNTNLIISGDVIKTDSYFSYLTRFFTEVKLNEIQILDVSQPIDQHRLLTLAALSLCASSEEN